MILVNSWSWASDYHPNIRDVMALIREKGWSGSRCSWVEFFFSYYGKCLRKVHPYFTSPYFQLNFIIIKYFGKKRDFPKEKTTPSKRRSLPLPRILDFAPWPEAVEEDQAALVSLHSAPTWAGSDRASAIRSLSHARRRSASETRKSPLRYRLARIFSSSWSCFATLSFQL